ncbi:MAG: type II toxin-antitoxin system VapC family toxin [Actinomycetota bacterium]
MRLYLDSSAIVKLVQREPESEALRRLLRRRRSEQLVTSALSRVEVVRAVLPGGPLAVSQARRQLGRLDLINLTSDLLDRAATVSPKGSLRSLDAIHLVCAQEVGAELRAIVTYDRRMADAALEMGLSVEAPT